MWLIVGLGNPGREYASHRHNVGFMVAEELLSRVGGGDFREKFSGRFARGSLHGEEVVLLTPHTFMNESGRSVQPAATFFKVEPARVLVVHDELDLPFAQLRLKVGGGHAGHNGLRSILQHLGTSDFARLRVGIGRPPPGSRGDVADFVLSAFSSEERAALPDLLRAACDAVADVAQHGVASATKKLHTNAPATAGGADPPRAREERSARRPSTEGKTPARS